MCGVPLRPWGRIVTHSRPCFSVPLIGRTWDTDKKKRRQAEISCVLTCTVEWEHDMPKNILSQMTRFTRASLHSRLNRQHAPALAPPYLPNDFIQHTSSNKLLPLSLIWKLDTFMSLRCWQFCCKYVWECILVVRMPALLLQRCLYSCCKDTLL